MLSQNAYKFDLYECTANQVTNTYTSDFAECISNPPVYQAEISCTHLTFTMYSEILNHYSITVTIYRHAQLPYITTLG